MNILITGGGGYIGSILLEYLVSDPKNHITLVDNFMFGQNSLGHLTHSKKLKIINADVNDMVKYESYLKTSDVIIPLAAFVGAPMCSRYNNLSKLTNYDAVSNLFNKIDKNQFILMPTTNSAYGKGDKDGKCDENSKLYPLSDYAIQKVKVEQELLQRENSISFRLATVFGTSPRMRLDLLVNDFVHKAFFDGYIVLFESHFRRNYIHIRDVAKVFIMALGNLEKMKSNIFNVGLSSANLTKLELCNKIKAHLKNFTIIESNLASDPDQRDYIVSNEKIESLGFKPEYSIDDGILELINYFNSIKKYQQLGNV